MDYSLIIPAFIAGILTFLAPCTLPLVPGYLAFIGGTSLNDLKDHPKDRKVRLKIFLNGLFFVIGFSAVFIILGTLAGLAGKTLGQYRFWLSRAGGILIIIFGLSMIGVLKIPILNKERKIRIPSIFKLGLPLNSFILGTTFAFGWTPCVGPILGAILALAAISTTVGQGAILLLVFSLGLAIPFLIIALAIGWTSQYLLKISKYLNIISFISGAFLIFFGTLLLTNKMAIWISYFYHLFSFLNYERLLDFL